MATERITKNTAKKTPSIKESSKEIVGKSASKKSVSVVKTSVEKTEPKLFAVIETGGKQYRVRVGDLLRVEKLGDKMNVGDSVVFDRVLLVDDGVKTDIGRPYLDGRSVKGVLQSEGLGKKVLVLRYKPKSRYSKKKGHRQPFSEVKITKI